jgi:hypothetical protein
MGKRESGEKGGKYLKQYTCDEEPFNAYFF